MRFSQPFVSAITLLVTVTSSMAIDSVDLVERGDSTSNACQNGGTPVCCQATFAGDLLTIDYLASLTNFQLDPNDVNCIGIRNDAFASANGRCPGVKACCKTILPKDVGGAVSTLGGALGELLSPVLQASVLGLYCQGINNTCAA